MGEWIHWAEYWYNTTYQSSAGKTPFEAVYDCKPPTLIRYSPGESSVVSVAQDLQDRDELLRQLKHNLLRAQQRMLKQANAHRRDISFSVGDMVFF